MIRRFSISLLLLLLLVFPMMSTARKIPTLILTGFLGSGKTTILNHLLASPRTTIKRIALIENEFASAFGVVEQELLPSHGHDAVKAMVELNDVYEFGFGCVCCSSSGELRRVLLQIAEKAGLIEGIDFAAEKFGDSWTSGVEPVDASNTESLDLVILETTGLADPRPVSDVITMDPAIAGAFELLGVVGVVDSDRVFRDLVAGKPDVKEAKAEYKNERIAQLLGSDVLVLSKTDLLPSTVDRDLLSSYISSHRRGFPASHIFHTVKGTGAPNLEELVALLSKPGPEKDTNPVDSRPHDPSVTHTALLAPPEAIISRTRLASGFAEFVKAHPGTILRIKGFIRTREGGNRRVLIHGVGDSPLSFELGREWEMDKGETELLSSTVTVIGRDVGRLRDELGRILEAATEK